MNQPPPHGWHQQQPPPPQGWPQQGYPPQPGWGPPQPPKKSKAPMIVGIIVAVVLLLGGGISALVLYLDVHEDSGSPKRADRLPSLCDNISEAALVKARTTNPNGVSSSESKLSTGTRTICAWNQTKGVDGTGHRSTDVYVTSGLEQAEVDFDRSVSQHMSTRGVPQQRKLDGLGDQATAVLVMGDSAYTDIWIIVRKSDTIVEIDYSGWDAGLFTNKAPEVAEFETAAKTLAEEMVTKL
ncbi:MAG TPA: hypothetical protein VF821_17930 [Lentzea sp.]